MMKEINTVEKTKCLSKLLADSTQNAKVGEFLKAAEAKLSELAGIAKAEEDSYRAASVDFNSQWQTQNKKICKIWTHQENCYQNGRTDLEEAVCKGVIQEIWMLRNQVMADIGPPEKRLDAANNAFEKAGAQLEAWKTISTWIGKRLDDNQILIDEICTLDNCKDRLFALYILHFELLPVHWQLKRKPADLPIHLTDPERAYCASACTSPPPPDSGDKCSGFPWLILPNDYNCELAALFECWRKAGEARAVAESDYEQIARDREELARISAPLLKRDNAKEALRKRDEENYSCEPGVQPDDGGSNPPGGRQPYGDDHPGASQPPDDRPPQGPSYDKLEDPTYRKPVDPPYDNPEDPTYRKPEDPPYDKHEDPPNDNPEDPTYRKPEDPPYDNPEDPPYDNPEDPPYDKHEDPPYRKPEDPPYDNSEDPPSELPPQRTPYEPEQPPYGGPATPPSKRSRYIGPEGLPPELPRGRPTQKPYDQSDALPDKGPGKGSDDHHQPLHKPER